MPSQTVVKKEEWVVEVKHGVLLGKGIGFARTKNASLEDTWFLGGRRLM